MTRSFSEEEIYPQVANHYIEMIANGLIKEESS